MIFILITAFSVILFCSVFFTVNSFFIISGICLGTLAIPFSFRIIKKPNVKRTPSILAVLSLIWGGFCLIALSMGGLKYGVEKLETAYIHNFLSPTHLCIFYKDYYRYENDETIRMDENWRKILENKYPSIEEEDYIVSEERTSYWSVNRNLDGRSIHSIDFDVILFVEMDAITKPIINKEEFLAQSWDTVSRRRVMLYDGRVYEYCHEDNKYYPTFKKRDNHLHARIKWE